MKEYLLDLIERYRSPGIIFDTSLLLLLLFGQLYPHRIDRFNRTKGHFVREDYARLVEVLPTPRKFVVTPQILTEVSNFLGQAYDEERAAVRNLIGTNVSLFDIQDIPLATLVGSPAFLKEFCKFGYTDAVMIHLARQGYLVVTVDGGLAHYIVESLGKEAFNYTQAICSSIPPAKWGR